MDEALIRKKTAEDLRTISLALEEFGRNYRAQVADSKVLVKAQSDTLAHARAAEENSLKAGHLAESAELAAKRAESAVESLRAELRDAMGRFTELEVAFERAYAREGEFQATVLELLRQVVSGQQNLLRDFVEPAKTQDDGTAATAMATAEQT